jgi:hypothetical protein
MDSPPQKLWVLQRLCWVKLRCLSWRSWWLLHCVLTIIPILQMTIYRTIYTRYERSGPSSADLICSSVNVHFFWSAFRTGIHSRNDASESLMTFWSLWPLMMFVKLGWSSYGFMDVRSSISISLQNPVQQCFVSIPIPFIRSETSSQFRRFPSMRLKCTIPHAIHFIIFKSRYYRIEYDAFEIDFSLTPNKASQNSGYLRTIVTDISTL